MLAAQDMRDRPGRPSRQPAASSGHDAAAEPKAERCHVVLVGFMGVGKSSVGRLLAECTGRAFVDLDEAIAASAGVSIRDLFRRGGEVAFRARERPALRDILASTSPLIVATGGTTFVDPTMRAWILKSGHTVYLQASPEALSARIAALEARARRPLVEGPDTVATIRRLVAARSSDYDQAETTVRTDGRRVEDIVDEIVRALRLEPANSSALRQAHGSGPPSRRPDGILRASPRRALAVAAPSARDPHCAHHEPEAPPDTILVARGSYAVRLCPDAGPWLAQAIAAECAGSRLALVVGPEVGPLHGEALDGQLQRLGKTVTVHTMSSEGLASPWAGVAELCDALGAMGIERSDAVVALGGQAVARLVGFASAIFRHGLRHACVPTSTTAVLGAADSGDPTLSVGAERVPIGVHHPPRAVLVACDLLRTQEPRVHASGLAQALALFAQHDAELFRRATRESPLLVDYAPKALPSFLRSAVALASQVATRTEQDKTEAPAAAFGHTLGEAIARGEGERLLWGEAIALGMLAEAEWAEAEGTAHGVLAELRGAFGGLGLATDWRAARLDAGALSKLAQYREVRMMVPERLGAAAARKVPAPALVEYINSRSRS